LEFDGYSLHYLLCCLSPGWLVGYSVKQLLNQRNKLTHGTTTLKDCNVLIQDVELYRSPHLWNDVHRHCRNWRLESVRMLSWKRQ